ncbi:MAG: metallophosphoesterase [Halodesulfurarchaeum sp.]
MLVVLSDTHRTDRPGLDGQLAEAVSRAHRVIHAGDFTTEAVLDGFQATADSLLAVAGNRDSPGVTARLPEARTLDLRGFTVALTHTRAGGQTGLAYFGDERDADLVISGHTHRPHVVSGTGPTLLNPGSHADPRGGEPTFAELTATEGAIEGAIRTVSGREKRRFRVKGRN